MKRLTKKLGVLTASLLGGVFAVGGVATLLPASAADLTATTDYTVVTDAQDVFQGISLTESVAGGLYVGAKKTVTLSDSFLYSVTEFQLGTNTTYDYDNGGLYLHLSTLGNTKNLNTRIYVFANDASGNVFFSRGGNEGSATYPILQNGEKVGEFKGVKNSLICTIAPNVSGTVSIPWSSMTKSGSASSGYADTLFEDLHDWRVAVQTDLTSASASAGEGLTVKSIGSYAKSGAEYQVVEGFNAQDVTYSYTGNVVNDAGVNFADIKSGSVVATAKKWDTAISIKNYKADSDGTVANKIEYGRTMTVNYVDEEGTPVKDSELRTITNIARTGDEFTYSFNYLDGGAAQPTVEKYSFLSTKTDFSTATVTHTYKKANIPQLVINYLDLYGNTLQETAISEMEYEAGTDSYVYEIVPAASIGDYNFVKASGALTGSIAKSSVTDSVPSVTVDLTYGLAYGEYTDFESISLDDGSFSGLKLTESMEGAFYFGVKSDAELLDGFANSVTEFKLSETIHDKDNGGLLIQYSTLGYEDFITKVGVFVKGTNNRFYSVVTGIKSSRTDTVIFDDGATGSIPVKKSDSRYTATLPGNTSGTWNIRWSDILDNTNGELVGIDQPEMRVVIWTDVSNATASHAIGNGLSVGCIATYQKVGDTVTVVNGISTTDLTYTYDATNTEADVNMSDIGLGKRIYNTHEWNEGVSVKNYKVDDDKNTTSLIEYGRTSVKQIPVTYVDEKGNELGDGGYAKLGYNESGMTYTVTPKTFTGYEYKSCNLPLSGTITNASDLEDMSFTLTYGKIMHTITFIYLDEEGKEIATSTTESAAYGEYCEFEAKAIDGYEFVEASRSLNITVMNDYTIKLTYKKTASSSSSCSSCGSSISGVGGVLLPLCGLAFIRKRRKNK